MSESVKPTNFGTGPRGMHSSQFEMAFTTGGLFQDESVRLAGRYLTTENWEIVREAAISENLLHSRTLSTSKRISREVVSRLKTLSISEIKNFLCEGTYEEQAHILWIAVCRRYQFIRQFAIEVIHERYSSLRKDLALEDFDVFYNRKAQWHTELDCIATSTRQKLRQVLFKILRDVGFLTSKGEIVPARPSQKLAEQMMLGDKEELLCFPAYEAGLSRISV